MAFGTKFRIKNRSPQFLVVTFNSGSTVHLAPQEVSDPMDEIEIKGNVRLQKMEKNLLVTIEEERKKKEKEMKPEKNKKPK